jgi:hypothetical protein
MGVYSNHERGPVASKWVGGRCHVTLYHAAPRQIEGALTNRLEYASRARDSYVTESRHDVTIAG